METGDKVGSYRIERQIWWDGPAGGYLGKHEETGDKVIVWPMPNWTDFRTNEQRRGTKWLEFQESMGRPRWMRRIIEVLPIPNDEATDDKDDFTKGEIIIMEATASESLVRLIMQGQHMPESFSSAWTSLPVSVAGIMDIAIQVVDAMTQIYDTGGFLFVSADDAHVTSKGTVTVADMIQDRETHFKGEAGLTQDPITPESPPEYIEKQDLSYTHMVYSLGATLFRVVTGQKPFDKGKYDTVIDMIKYFMAERGPDDTGVPDIRELRPDAPEALVTMIEDFTRWDPAKRPKSKAEVLSVIEVTCDKLNIEPASIRIEATGLGPR